LSSVRPARKKRSEHRKRGVVDGSGGEGKAGGEGEYRRVVGVEKGDEGFILELQGLNSSSS